MSVSVNVAIEDFFKVNDLVVSQLVIISVAVTVKTTPVVDIDEVSVINII